MTATHAPAWAADFPTDVTAVIPHIPVRRTFLRSALISVQRQTHPVAAISVAVDLKREGSAVTRTRALNAAATTWVAFLDDDDVWLPYHLETLLAGAVSSGADVVYSCCEVRNGDGSVSWQSFGQPFDAKLLYERPYMNVTCLARTELAQRARFDDDWDEWGFFRRIHTAGAKIHHVPGVTWIWQGGEHSTSGQPDRW